ncbi:hypothetical protein [Embleya scabrispora]|uniref:hypothetical protein n=1 Tax=Embleya scabrispora TaxID=159449 RepID=UPI000360AADB|nr:hypothetical protein [Embleya scabrispora]MYS80947.1 hypothetical protein [Streptomyces sp. SID5474]
MAEAQQIARRLAYDADRHELSHRPTTRAVRTARLAGDRSAEHFALSQLAMQAIPLFEQAAAGRIPGSRTAHNDHAYLLHALVRTRAWRDAGDLLESHILPARSTIAFGRITRLLADTADPPTLRPAAPAGHGPAHDPTALLRGTRVPATTANRDRPRHR